MFPLFPRFLLFDWTLENRAFQDPSSFPGSGVERSPQRVLGKVLPIARGVLSGGTHALLCGHRHACGFGQHFYVAARLGADAARRRSPGQGIPRCAPPNRSI
eukprot:6944969-Pyramimonas_sp.AAC.1